jgi:hypothetical protein
MAALAFGGRPVGTVALPPAATITPRLLTAAQGGTSGIGSVTVVSPIRPVEVYDAEVDAGTPGSSDTPSATSGTTRNETPGPSRSSGSSGSSAPAGSAGTGAPGEGAGEAAGGGAGGGGGTVGATPGATTTTTSTWGGSTDGSDDTTNDGSDDPGATATTTVGSGPVDNARVGTVPRGS